VFRQVEGLPLYRYQMRLRLARALTLLAQYDDLTALGLRSRFFQPQPFQRRIPRSLWAHAFGIQAVRRGALGALIRALALAKLKLRFGVVSAIQTNSCNGPVLSKNFKSMICATSVVVANAHCLRSGK
jgi:hypothetical protein